MAELLKLHYPQLLEIHNCIPTNNVSTKKDNWNNLNRKVFSKINLKLNNNIVSQLANCQHGTIEKLLFSLIDQITNNDNNSSSRDPVQEIEIIENVDESINEIIQEIPRVDSKIPQIIEKEKFFSFFSKMGKNIFNHLMTFLMQASCIWRWFGNLQIIKGDLEIENKYISGNNYLYETRSETYFNEEIDDTAARWAYEQLIEEIREKEDIISTLNHKVAYLEGTMRQKDLRIANLMIQITNESLEVPSNLKKRSSICGSMKLRPKTYNSQLINSYKN
ncbi:uncharacterized protein LOC127283598 isoform X2 [Leptopilina boulardi]|nr:uncharacterized protein LOC127283598 isoform X2 [Leptopilina boulardi]